MITQKETTHPDNLQSELVVVRVAPLVEAEPLRLGPVHAAGAQVALGQRQPQLKREKDKDSVTKSVKKNKKSFHSLT